jgi:diacylglycerol kinase
MSKFKCQGFLNTCKNAQRGIRLVLKAEDSIKVHVIAAALVLIAAAVLGFSAEKFCILFLTIAMVMITETLNSALEFSADAVFHNKYSTLVGMAKDISAGAVMVATFTSVAIGLTLFVPALLDLVKSLSQ